MQSTASPATNSGTSTPRSTDASGYLLLTIPHAIITQVYDEEHAVLARGELRLECISLPIPSEIGHQTANPFAPSPSDPITPTHDFWLIIHVGPTFEMPIIPTTPFLPSPGGIAAEGIKYTVASSTIANAHIVITLPLPATNAELEDLDSFEVLLHQYRCLPAESTALAEVVVSPKAKAGAMDDLRGKLVLINEDSGEIVGELDQSIDLQEDQRIGQGSLDKPVMLDFGDVMDGYAPTVQVKTVPENEMDDWLLKGAHHISRGILTGGSWANKGIKSGADLFIRNTKANEKPVTLGPKAKAGVRIAHNTSVRTVNVTKSTVGMINNALSKVAEKGYEKGVAPALEFYGVSQSRRQSESSKAGLPPPLPVRKENMPLLQGQGQNLVESPITAIGPSIARTSSPNAPPIPPKPIHLAQNSAAAAAAPPSYGSIVSEKTSTASTPPRTSTPTTARTKRPLLNRILLAGEVVLTSVESTVQEIISAGTQAASSTAEHKYGAEVGRATELLGGSVRNVAVVYIDVRGVGRKALLQGTAKGFVKARLNNGETVVLSGEGTEVKIQGEEVRLEEGEVERTKEGLVIGMAEVQPISEKAQFVAK